MMDHERDGWGDDGGLGPLLDAYADARLAADPEATGAVRARIVAEARRQAAGRAAAAPAATTRGGRVRWTPGRLFRTPSFVGATVLLAMLLLAGGALATSGPGGLLYGPRLWLEELTLPSDPAARLEAQVARLEERLAEAEAAAQRGDPAAAAAALEAYRRAAEEAFDDAGQSLDRQERLATALGRHVAVLEAVAGEVPAAAAAAIEKAIERTEARIEEILATPPGKPVKPAASPHPAGPAATPVSKPTPDRTPPGKPDPTAKPTKAPTPERSPGKPDRTPVPPGRQSPNP